MKHTDNKTRLLKALIEATGDDFNTYLCSMGEDATRMREEGYLEAIITRNIETAIDNKIADLIDYFQQPVAA